MRRGTTPTHIFTYEGVTDEGHAINLAEADELYITYQQAGINLLEKTLEDCTFGENTVSVTLTQAETLAFSGIGAVSVQIRAKFGSQAVACNIIKTTVEEILKDGEI